MRKGGRGGTGAFRRGTGGQQLAVPTLWQSRWGHPPRHSGGVPAGPGGSPALGGPQSLPYPSSRPGCSSGGTRPAGSAR